MDYSEVDLLLKYPFVRVNHGETSTKFTGTIEVNYEDYEIYVKSYHASNDYKVKVTPTLTPFRSEIEASFDTNFKNIEGILDTIKAIIQKNNPAIVLQNHTGTYKKVINEYVEFTNFYFNLNTCSLSEDLTRIKVSTYDERRCEHFLEIAINYNEPTDIFEMDIYELPKKQHDKDLFRKSSSLTMLYDEFLSYLESLQAFWQLMEAFDRSCWIIDPETPKKADNYRRICIGNNVSIILTVDPYKPFERPDIKFLGPDNKVQKFRRNMNKNLAEFDGSDVFQGVLDLLGLESFPLKPDQFEKLIVLKDDEDCSMCYSLRLDGKLPEIICQNPCCRNCYHTACLYEWLTSFRSNVVFKEITGQCPNCEKRISCPIPK